MEREARERERRGGGVVGGGGRERGLGGGRWRWRGSVLEFKHVVNRMCHLNKDKGK